MLGGEMVSIRFWFCTVCLLILSLAVAGCGSVASEPDWQTSPLAQASPSPAPAFTSTPTPASTSTPQPAPTFTPVPLPAPAANQLVVLHTNDNWGETEPCG